MVVMEYAAGGTLMAKLAADGMDGAPRRVGWYGRGRLLAHGVATGLAYLHAHKIIHFDIKSSNVLLDRAGLTAKIADVGLSKISRGSAVSQTMRCGAARRRAARARRAGLTAAVGARAHRLLLEKEPVSMRPRDRRPGCTQKHLCPTTIARVFVFLVRPQRCSQ